MVIKLQVHCCKPIVVHSYYIAGGMIVARAVSEVLAGSHLLQRVGIYYSRAFANSRYGTVEGLKIINRISPKYAEPFENLINEFGSEFASQMEITFEEEGINELEEIVEILDIKNSFKLTYNGNGTWTSTEGIIYGQGSRQGNRVLHILEHTKPNPSKPLHTMFNVSKHEVITLVDEAWLLKGTGVLQNNGNVMYEINMGRIIGTNGEDTMIIITNGYTNEIV